MLKRKYPSSLFIMGIFLNLLKTWYILLLAIFLLIAVFIGEMSILVPVAILVVWIVVAIVVQLRYRKIALTLSPNENVNDIFDSMFADNDKGYRNVIDTINDIIDKDKPDS